MGQYVLPYLIDVTREGDYLSIEIVQVVAGALIALPPLRDLDYYSPGNYTAYIPNSHDIIAE
jgi:hypothetical protein